MNWKPFKSFGEYLELIGTVTGQPIPAALGSLIKGGVIGAEFADALTPKYSELEKHIKQYIEEKYPEHHKKLEKEIEPVLERINQHYVTEFCSVKLDERDYVLDEIMVRYHGENRESCREILRWTLEEIHTQIQDVAPTVATMIKLYGKIDSVEEKIDEILEFLRKHFDMERKALAGENVITDHNNLFRKKLRMPLFLEDGDNKAKLYQVFVKPQIANSQKDIISILSEWLEPDENKPLLLYGKPGVGKSTLTAFLVAVSERNADFWATLSTEEQAACESLADQLAGRLHTLVLNKHVQTIDCDDAWRSVKQCFGDLDDAAYDNKILILDGLDEVCVLKQNFNGYTFLKHLSGVLTGFNFDHNVKILITSRSGYFEPLNHTDYLIERTIHWTEAEMQEWCRKYTQARIDLQENCACVLSEYNDLAADDDRRDIFCVPIILYMCCHEDIKIAAHHSVAGIYSEIFQKIYKEKAFQRTPELDAPNEIQYHISWQFTKELAYQMHLHGKLETAIDHQLVQNAMNRTKAVLREKMPQDKELEETLKDISENDFDQYFQTHFAIMHFQSGDTKHGAEFAHKTVGEYFTAVKLYEDYFECIKNPETTTEQVWRNIFEAFRYKDVPEDIMKFLVEMTKKGLGEPPEKLFDHYYKGMEKQMPWKVLNTPMVEEYLFEFEEYLLPNQLGSGFCELTRCLTYLGFDNSQSTSTSNAVLGSLFRQWSSRVACCNGWKLQDADLRNAILRTANLGGANLESADLSNADLKLANLHRANLCGADLCGTDLCGADLSGAIINKFDFGILPEVVRCRYTLVSISYSQCGRLCLK